MAHVRAPVVSVRLTGVIAQGMPITPSDEYVTISAEKIDAGEIVLRVGRDVTEFGLRARDLLIVEPRLHQQAATGEFVIALQGERAFIGRWWAKHGQRMLLDDAFQTIARALRVYGAITLIVRDE
jgi:hypothetical protein